MSIPNFFINDIPSSNETFSLDEENSRHIVQVLRIQAGEKIALLNGRGKKVIAEIIESHKKHCRVQPGAMEEIVAPQRKVCIAISLLKNTSRFEWFLEKATEIGVTQIVPLICARTEKQKFRSDRMRAILVSAMMQSQQAWLPEIEEPVQFSSFVQRNLSGSLFIAHCREDAERDPVERFPTGDSTILIGPEGDFSAEEITEALKRKFQPVTLGTTRLRTETAGVVAATLLCREF